MITTSTPSSQPNTSTSRTRHAVVCGGGPGGAAAGLLLAAAGCRVTVLERQHTTGAIGGALLLQANGLAVLGGLGLGPALAEERHLSTSAVRDRRGRLILEAPAHRGGEGLDANVVIRRARLHALLHEALASHPSVDLRFSHTARSLQGSSVEVEGPTGTDVVEADLVVVADGIRSRIRSSITEAAVRPGPTYVRAVVPGPIPGGTDGEWWTNLGLFGAAELADGATYVFASAAHPDLARSIEGRDHVAFARRWTEELPLAGALLGRAGSWDDLMVHRADEVQAPTWVGDRSVLLGDAAHAMLPNTGQGANSALVDAAILALEIARDQPLAEALAAYDQRRRPATDRAASDARRLAALAHLRSPVARALRGPLVRAASHLPQERRARRLHQEDPSDLRDRCSALVAAGATQGR